MNSLEPVLEFLIGKYQYNLFILPNGDVVSALSGLDYAYFCRFILLSLGFIMCMSLLTRTIQRLFGKVK